MTKPLSASESHRVAYINDLMARLNAHTDCLYEDLMDFELEAAQRTAQELIVLLDDVVSSLDESSNSH
ncbi:MAG TPA: hypothetical protein EYO58_07515 [Flavobacteriales bacterium]|nr:hypothetical protein [Flavobacteriales bacterium]